MKKFAFILMGSSFDTTKQKIKFETDGSLTAIYTVNSFSDAKTLIKRLIEEGYGCVELCGAFGKEGAKKLIEATDNKIAIGYVVHEPSQDALFEAFWG